jgi:hypothetical protein
MFIFLIASIFALLFKVFLCLWKLHMTLQRAVLGNAELELPRVPQSLFLLWKWSGITVITFLAAMLISITIITIIAGFGSGLSTHMFWNFR